MSTFEEFEARETEKLSRLLKAVEADIDGTGPPVSGIAGEVVAEFKPLLARTKEQMKQKLTDKEIDEMTEQVINRIYKLVT